jgi:phosphohistidine phosphatase
LILFRHAKSDWETSFGQDHDRPLAKRGLKTAPEMGRLLASAGQSPGMVLTSSALRARETARLANEGGDWRAEIRVTDRLYDAGLDDHLSAARLLPSDCGIGMLVGHEPCLSEFAVALMGGGAIQMPTGAMVRIDFDVDDWSAIEFSRGRLVWLLPPRFFAAMDL